MHFFEKFQIRFFNFFFFFAEIGKWIIELKIAHSDLHFINIYLGFMNKAFYVVWVWMQKTTQVCKNSAKKACGISAGRGN